ncbi:hypothetical protein MLD38_013259 [Melastoma candidum]|uniref:Uncharacterized protein n=1 Tax=Melastoma candidum TaxID=119954 RepID=A0ACB9RC47_9MYRT|nr:hypothetical protein MLD38_013259 [Melastoma candidum]
MGLLLGPNVNVLGFTPPTLLLFLLCLLLVALSSSAGPPSSAASSPGGICSSAVVSHGYKCQEFDVRVCAPSPFFWVLDGIC